MADTRIAPPGVVLEVPAVFLERCRELARLVSASPTGLVLSCPTDRVRRLAMELAWEFGDNPERVA